MHDASDPQNIVRAMEAVQQSGGPFDRHMIIPTLWVVLLSIVAGVVSFARKVREGAARRFNFAELLGECMTSALVGLITFWLCEWAGANKYLEAALIAVAAHMGTRALFRFERVLEAWVDKKFPGLRSDDPKE